MLVRDIDKFSSLIKITNSILRQRTREGLFQEIAAVLQPLFGFDRISILLKSSGSLNWGYFSPAIGTMIPSRSGNLRPPARAAVPLMAMQQQCTIIKNLRAEPDLPEAEELCEAGLYWMVSTPLVLNERVLGSMQFFYAAVCEVDESNIDWLETVSQQVAHAIDNMCAHEDLRHINEQLAEHTSYLEQTLEFLGDPNEIIYRSLTMQRLLDVIRNVASTDTTVLITGETGTGKELIARKIHAASTRSDKTFIKVNCAALVPTLIESELFGHERGAFTGASARKIGRFQIAQHSTLFMDEIGELPLNTQAKLLQVLQEGVFERVGGTEPIHTDVRIVAATNLDLHALVAEKRFREDLFYRLNIFPIHVPPLRERSEDIPVLGKYFIMRLCEKLHRQRPHLQPDATDMLMRYSWPGNVRELQNFIERIIILRSGQSVTSTDIQSILNVGGDIQADDMRMVDVERNYIEKVLQKTRGRVAGDGGAADLLGMKRSTLQYKLKKHGLRPADYR